MAYTRYVYNRVNWKNKSESLETPLGKTNLNRMDSAIYYIVENLDIAYNEFSTGKFDKADADKVIVGMPTWDNNTGILTFRFYDGTEFSVDFNIEKIPVSFSMDSAGVITMTTADGTEWTADIGNLIPDYVFNDSDRIAFTKTKNTDGSYSVSADIKKNSITGDYLQPDYLSDVTEQASNAAASAKSASDSADSAAYDAKLSQSYAIGGSGIREGEDEDNAKKSKEDAEAAKISAESFKNSAKESASSASSSASSALESKGAAESAKEESQQYAKESASSASSSSSSAVIAAEKAAESSNSASSSSASAESSEKSAVKSESFAKGGTGTRPGEDSDCAKYYYEQTKRISQSQSGVVPMGTISFSGLSDEENQKSGYMFNISDSFVSDERFTDGGGIFYGEGNNVIYTADGKWDALAASSVTGVKGASESTYRQGNVNITKSDIGLALVENTEDRNKNVKSARKILDEGNLNEISVQYSGTGIQSAEWLAAWNGYKIEAIHISNVSVGNADTVDGYHVWDGQAYPYDKPYIPLVIDDGVMEVGRYMDFHIQGSSADYDARFNIDSAGNFELSSPAYAPKIVASRAFAGYGEEQFLVANPTYPNASVKAYVDQEGANFRLTPNNANNYYEFDTLGEGFRLYHYYNGTTPTLISSVGSGANLELQIARAIKDSNGNNIANTYVRIGGTTNTLEVTSGIKVTGAKGIHTGNNPLYLTNNNGQSSDDNAAGIQINSNNILPYVKGYYEGYKIYLGTSSKPFGGVYSATSLHVISDKRKKDNINELNAQTTEKLIEKIKSVSYTLKDGESGRTHYGMISQQVEEVLNELGIDSKDFAAFIKSPVTEDVMEQATNDEGELLFDEENNPIMIKVGENKTEDFIYMLRYEEFIPILWKNAQEKNKQIEELRHSNQENIIKINELEQRVEKLEENLTICY